MNHSVDLLGQIPDFETEECLQSYCRWLTGEQYDAVATNLRALIQFGPPWQGKTVAYLGCGPGRFASVLREFGVFRIIGVDQSEAMIRAARASDGVDAGCATDRIDYRLGRIANLCAIIPEGIDIAIAHETMGYVPNLRRYVIQLAPP